jgi:S1-C subfamily serine protease
MYDEAQQPNNERNDQPAGQSFEQPLGQPFEQPAFQVPAYGQFGQPVVPARGGLLRRRAGGLAAATALGVTAYLITSSFTSAGGTAVASAPGLSSSSSSALPSWSNGTRMFWRGGMIQQYLGNSGFGQQYSGSPTTTGSAPTAAQRAAGAAAEKRVAPGVVDVVSRLSDGIGAGTGIVLSPNGLILTNNHVVDGAEAIEATDIATGQTYAAKLVGRDPTKDIAVLQLVGASGLPVAPLSSSPAAVGQTVVGVGNALGRGGTPSYAVGTVTALNRAVTATDEGGSSPERVSGMIQSTTGIEPGDSGGPLVNTSGQVVGMDTAGEFSSSNPDAPAQVSFAIPISTALNVAHELENGTDPNGTTAASDGSSGLNILGLPL